jgi:hypothetical protein
MRKVYVKVTSRLILNMDEGVEIEDFISNMDYDFTSNTDGVDIHDMEITDFEITDSK